MQFFAIRGFFLTKYFYDNVSKALSFISTTFSLSKHNFLQIKSKKFNFASINFFSNPPREKPLFFYDFTHSIFIAYCATIRLKLYAKAV